jgi:hypothetical protein
VLPARRAEIGRFISCWRFPGGIGKFPADELAGDLVSGRTILPASAGGRLGGRPLYGGLGRSPQSSRGCGYISSSAQSGDIFTDFIDLVRTMDKERFIPVPRQLIYRIAAYGTGFQMRQNFQFFVQSQLLVKQLNQLLKVACVHNPSR